MLKFCCPRMPVSFRRIITDGSVKSQKNRHTGEKRSPEPAEITGFRRNTALGFPGTKFASTVNRSCPRTGYKILCIFLEKAKPDPYIFLSDLFFVFTFISFYHILVYLNFSEGVQKLYFCMGSREPGPCKNTISALRDSRKNISGENFSIC